MKHKLLRLFLIGTALLGTELAYSQSFENDRIYNAYLKIQEATVAGEFEVALEGINKLANYKTADVETAAILRARGFILLNMDRGNETINDFQTAIDLDVLNVQMEQEMRYVIANLLASAEEWQKSYDVFQTWLNIANSEIAEQEGLPKPDVDAYSLGAAIASNCDDFPFAIDCTEKAIQISPEPKRELYNLLIALHFQNSDLKKAVESLQRALAAFPDDNEFWKTLSSIYQLLQEDKEALAALVIAYDEDMMTKKEEYLLLGRFYMFNKMPFNGAEVISTGLERGVLTESKENLELLSQAWFSAREFENSLEVLKKIVHSTGDEEATLRATQILIDQEKHQQALELLDIGLNNEEVEDLGNLYKLQGYAYYGLKQYAKAVEAFTKAGTADPEDKPDYDQWIDYLKTEFLAQAD
ncbi:tetratricopeptide repeat protein [Pelagicoccus albus]|uniref:Tetratricopeptide repeat-containing protein n=1 Tax=Pelagicoccus albus TaxID=415222 RepID=A0A7X1B8W2_9BACT|nr:hypothetical protein [Pelagicoccus albus]MBC2607811.1 hypothetical protein [Pelagicoccus albus]